MTKQNNQSVVNGFPQCLECGAKFKPVWYLKGHKCSGTKRRENLR